MAGSHTESKNRMSTAHPFQPSCCACPLERARSSCLELLAVDFFAYRLFLVESMAGGWDGVTQGY